VCRVIYILLLLGFLFYRFALPKNIPDIVINGRVVYSSKGEEKEKVSIELTDDE
jgi:hypothetical protein